jgi:hypothetical protein
MLCHCRRRDEIMTRWSYFYVIENQLLNMSDAINSNEILYELKAIREDLDYIKGHMVDIDSILTEKDYLSIQACYYASCHQGQCFLTVVSNQSLVPVSSLA